MKPDNNCNTVPIEGSIKPLDFMSSSSNSTSIANYHIKNDYKEKDLVIVITGPTASGKSAVAIELCKAIGGEVVCADSMQLYRYMDIGTAKPSLEELQGIQHHLMDILDPVQTFSVADYKLAATKVINEILSRGNVPVLCGGTGQYLTTMIEGTVYAQIKSDPALRKGLETKLEECGIDALFDELKDIDPDTAAVLHKNDIKRILRAIEVYQSTGMTKTQLNKISKEKGPDFNYISFCITHDREILYERINQRVDKMIKEGLIEEIKNLLYTFPTLSNTAYQAIGYKEFIPFLQGEITLDEAISKVKQATRNYAKRQTTWFKKMDSLIWINNQSTIQIVDFIHRNI